MRAGLRSALASALADNSVRVIVLDHAGRVFCSGLDLAEAAGGAPGDTSMASLAEVEALVAGAGGRVQQ